MIARINSSANAIVSRLHGCEDSSPDAAIDALLQCVGDEMTTVDTDGGMLVYVDLETAPQDESGAR